MEANVGVSDTSLPLPPVWGPLAPYDVRCTREFYRYYHPFQALYPRPPPWVDLHDAAAVAAHTPVASPDKALTAFLQLVAVKLRVHRALLFFFDDRHGYILAEATQSLSLQRDFSHDPDDGLWLGYTTIPKGFSVCEHTANLPVNKGSNSTHPSAARVHIIDDMKEDTRFACRPYVTGGPLARFYAGVPIVTPTGVHIGALCALGTEPRMGLPDGEIDFLCDMAATIMDHLESLRARAEHKRGMHMIAGLSTFIQGMASSSEDRGASSVSNDPDLPTPTTFVMQDGDTSRDDAQSPFQSAASIVQKALDLDGVLFLDTSISTFGGLAGEPNQISTLDGVDSDDSMTAYDIASDHNEPRTPKNTHSQRGTCALLAASYANQSPVNYRPISQRTLRALCRRYPRGKIWCFHRDDSPGPASSDGNLASPTSPPLDSVLDSLLGFEANPRAVRKHRRQLRRQRQHEELAKLVPGVQCLALIPVRDNSSGKWRAGAVIYTFSPQRTFSPEGELNFMAAFGDVLVAELALAETQSTLQAKSAFMSSLSHDVRTPLHGILGTVEQLYEETSPSVAAKMLSQIELCGRTLLDVMNHLLDFSQVSRECDDGNSGSIDDSSHSDPDSAVQFVRNNNNRQPHPVQSAVLLDRITEEAIESCILSHRSTSNSEQLRNPSVTTTLHITSDSNLNWSVQILEGAWKRICMNLVSNALKYTQNGYVLITLKQKPSLNVRGPSSAIFSVEDSGRGMSREYMTRSLFRPFMQEDSFAPGSGLGMSIVAQLVRSMQGRVDVQSHLGRGTTVTVTVPLHTTNNGPRPGPPVPRNVSARLLGDWPSVSSTSSSRPRFLLCSGIRRIFENLGVTLMSSEDTSLATVVVVLEEDWAAFNEKRSDMSSRRTSSTSNASKPVILICKTHASARRLETIHGHPDAGIGFVPEPYSRTQVAEAVNACLTPVERNGPDHAKQSHISRRPLLRRISSSPQKGDILRHNSVPTLSPASKPTSYFPEKPLRSDQQRSERHMPVTSPLLVLTPPDIIFSSGLPAPGNAGATNAATPTNPKTEDEGGLTVLLVDDNNINLQLLSTYCKRKGHRSSTVTGGQQAVNHYQQSILAQMSQDVSARYTIQGERILRVCDPPQVILMDINMPVMDGFEASQEIRRFERKTGVETPVFIIAMTGLSSDEARLRAFASGIDLFFPKPVRLRELTDVLKKRFEGNVR